jgi:hypothetical protein
MDLTGAAHYYKLSADQDYVQWAESIRRPPASRVWNLD